MKKKKMGTKIIAFAVAVLMTTASVVAIMNTEYAVENNEKSTKKVAKPGQVKGLKKLKDTCKWDGHRNVNSVKISFKKVKGVTGYQVLIYRTIKLNKNRTPLVYAKTTKNTTYTIKNLVPGVTYEVKVRAYKKEKSGKFIYGKTKSIKFKTKGEKSGCYYTCNTCGAAMPGNAYRIAEHGESVRKVCKELHAGGTYFWK